MGNSLIVAPSENREKPLPAGQYWAGVKVQNLDSMWPMLEPFIERLLAQGDGEQSIEHIKQQALDGEVAVWIFGVPGRIDLVVLTQIRTLPNFSIGLLYGLVGQELPKYLHFYYEILEPWFKEHGAVYVETVCRPGLERSLKDWKKKFSVMRRYL